MNRFQFVADHQQRYGVKRLCQIIGVSRSSYYYWRSTAPARAARDAADVVLVGRIRADQGSSPAFRRSWTASVSWLGADGCTAISPRGRS